MRKRFLTMLLGLGLVLSMFVGALGTASADHTGTQDAYFPWVPNGADLVGIDGETSGPWYGTVTVQNIESDPIEVDFYVGVPGDGYELRRTEAVDPYASTTVSSAQLAVSGDGDGFAVKAVGYLQREVLGTDDDDNEIVVQEEIRAHIAGAAKQVSPIASGDGKTNSGHIEVDGYSAQTENMVGGGNHILPIVQTNSGWNTDIKIANWSDGGASQSITVNFYGAFGEGVSGSSSGTYSLSLDPGEVESVNLDQLEGSLNLGEDFIGSAWIESSSTAQISAVAERVKPMDDMLVMNTSRPESHGNGTKYAPLVFQNYNMWNTGISVANLSDSINTVQIDFHGPTTSGQISEVLEIAPRSMEYLYIPGMQELGLDDDGFVGSAILQGTGDFHASVDQIKYFGSGQDVGSAMSYITEHETAGDSNPQDAVGDGMALPIYGKGNDAGNGDTSGIQLFNASADESVNAHITFYNQAGNPVAPTINTPRTVSLAPRESRTVYALDMGTMPDGFFGSAIISVSGEGELVGVSNQVNYDVGGDGSVAFNLVRVPGEPAPSTATNVSIDPVTDTNIWGDTHSITVNVTDQFGEPMSDVGVNATITEGPHRNFSHEDDVKSGSTLDGVFVISYKGDNPHHGLSQDTIAITVDGVDGVFTATKTWEFGEPTTIELAHVEEFEGEIPANVIFYDEHEVVATVRDQNNNLLMDVDVDFNVENSQNPHSGSDDTDDNGQAFFSYTSENTTPQTPHNIVATVPGTDLSASVQKNWVDFEISLAHHDGYDSAVPNITFVTEHEVVASLTRVDTGAGIDGAEIGFNIDGDQSQTGYTDVDGNVPFVYTAEEAGDDQLSATALLANRTSAEITKTWVDLAVQVTPEESTNNVGDQHTVTVQIGYDDEGTFVPVEMSGYAIELALDGAETNAHPEFFPRNLTTGADGSASYTYTGARVGTDYFVATLGVNGNQDTATKTWIDMEINITGQGDGQNYVFLEEHFVTVQVTDEGSGDGLGGQQVEFRISGPNADVDNVRWEGDGADDGNVGTTDADGNVTFFYTGERTGSDNLQARFADGGSFAPQTESKNWVAVFLNLEHVGSDLNIDGDTHEVVATLVDGPYPGANTITGFSPAITFEIEGGAIQPDAADENIDPATGQASMSYSFVSGNTGDGEAHSIVAMLNDTTIVSNEITKTWYEQSGEVVFDVITPLSSDIDGNETWWGYELRARVVDQFGFDMTDEIVDLSVQSVDPAQTDFVDGLLPDQVDTGADGLQGEFTYYVDYFENAYDFDFVVTLLGVGQSAGVTDGTIDLDFNEQGTELAELILEFNPAPENPVIATENDVELIATAFDQNGNVIPNLLITFEMYEGYSNETGDNVGLRKSGQGNTYVQIIQQTTGDEGEPAVVLARKGPDTPAPKTAVVGAYAGTGSGLVYSDPEQQEIQWIQVGTEITFDIEGDFTNIIGSGEFEVTGTLRDQEGFPISETDDAIDFFATNVNDDADVETELLAIPEGSASATFSYDRDFEVTDEITASLASDSSVVSTTQLTKTWTELKVTLSHAPGNDDTNFAHIEPHTMIAQLTDSNDDQVMMADEEISFSIDFTGSVGEPSDLIFVEVNGDDVDSMDQSEWVGETDGSGQVTFTFLGANSENNQQYTTPVVATAETSGNMSTPLDKLWLPIGVEITHGDGSTDEAFNIDGEEHTVIAQLIDESGNAIGGLPVGVTFASTADAGDPGSYTVLGTHDPNDDPEPNSEVSGETNADGQLAYTFAFEFDETADMGDTHSIDLSASIDDTNTASGTVTKTWYTQEPTTIVLATSSDQYEVVENPTFDFYDVTATVYDQQGLPIEGIAVTFDRDGGPGSFFWDGSGQGAQVVASPTDALGQIEVSYRVNRDNQAANYPITINVTASAGAATSNTVPLEYTLDPSIATELVLTTDPNPSTTGQFFELYVVILDQHGVPMDDKNVFFDMIAGYSEGTNNNVGLRNLGNPGQFEKIIVGSTGSAGEANVRAFRGPNVAPPRFATVKAFFPKDEGPDLEAFVDLEWVLSQQSSFGTTNVESVDLPPGGVAWSAPLSNALSAGPDGNLTSVILQDTEFSQRLWWDQFNFNLPAGSTVTGIEVTLWRDASGAGIQDLDARIVGLAPLESNSLALLGDWPISVIEPVTYGGPGSLFGLGTLDESDINHPNFGFHVAAENTSGGPLGASVDAVEITVHYWE